MTFTESSTFPTGDQKTVNAADWQWTGFKDGRHGNSKFPPHDPVSRNEYMIGFLEGRAVAISEGR